MKKSYEEYVSIINNKKHEAHNISWLYIELNAQDLVNEVEPKVSNIKVAAQAMLDTMLEGDLFVVTPKAANKLSKDLRVRYYCDNLDPSRRSFAEVD